MPRHRGRRRRPPPWHRSRRRLAGRPGSSQRWWHPRRRPGRSSASARSIAATSSSTSSPLACSSARSSAVMTLAPSLAGDATNSTVATPSSIRVSKWPAQVASSRSGKSSRQCDPRVSSRCVAASVSAAEMVTRLVVSQAARSTVSAVRVLSLSIRTPASSRPAALRSTPTRELMTSCSSPRTSPATRPRVRSSATGSAHGRSSPGSTPAIRREKTRPSSNELDARRLAPCTPEQATSPVA